MTIFELVNFAKKKANPEDILILSDFDNISIKIECAKRKHCPREVLVKLSEDPWWGVRLAVAINKKTPKSVIKRLMVDDNQIVQRYARLHQHAKDFFVFE